MRHPHLHTDDADGLGELGDNQAFGQPRPLGNIMLDGGAGGGTEEGDSSYIPGGVDEGDTHLVQIGRRRNARLNKVRKYSQA